MSETWVTANFEFSIIVHIFAASLILNSQQNGFIRTSKEFRALQKTHKIRVADFCRERTLDYYEMVEALKKDKLLSELPKEEIEMGEVDITDYPLERPDPKALSYIQEVSIQTPSELKVRICGITASDLITVVGKLMTIRPC